MKEPKYSFNQRLTKEVQTEYEGVYSHQTVTHTIVGIRAVSSDTDFEYEYLLASRFPAAYVQPTWTSTWISEGSIKKTYNTAKGPDV